MLGLSCTKLRLSCASYLARLYKAVLAIWVSQISINLSLVKIDFLGWGWVTGSSENKAKLAQLGLKIGLSLAISH
jgi:hypothetical protein